MLPCTLRCRLFELEPRLRQNRSPPPRDNPHAPVITIGEAVGVVEEVTGRPVHYTTIRRWLKTYPALGYQLPSGAWRVFESELRRHLMRGRERPARNEIDAT